MMELRARHWRQAFCVLEWSGVHLHEPHTLPLLPILFLIWHISKPIQSCRCWSDSVSSSRKRETLNWIGGLSIKKGIEGLEKTHNIVAFRTFV